MEANQGKASAEDIASLVFKMEGMEVLDRESMALVPPGTFSRSLWHAAALSSELNRMLRIQDHVYRQYRAEQTAKVSVDADAENNEAEEVEAKPGPSSMSLVPYDYKRNTLRRKKLFRSDFNSFTSERFRWRRKRSCALDTNACEKEMEDVTEQYCPRKRRYQIPFKIQRPASRESDDAVCYSRINGVPIYQDSRFQSAEIQIYLLNLINEDRERQIDAIQKASTGGDYEVDGKILKVEQFLQACKTELTAAFTITQGLKRLGLKGATGEAIKDQVGTDILRKAGISFSFDEVPQVQISSEEIDPTRNRFIYGSTVQEFPDD